MNLRAAIDAKCKDCLYDPAVGGGWRQQVADCTAVNCPLYPVRAKPLCLSLTRRRSVKKLPDLTSFSPLVTAK